MIRIVSTNNSGVYIDPYFEKNYNGAKSVGIPVGCYLYTYATTEEQQNKEILLALDALNGKTIEYPFALDVEDSSLVSMGKASLSALVQRGLVIIDQKGYVPMLYTYTNYTKNLDMSMFDGYDLWIADYRGYNGYGQTSMWQYSSSGKVNGISGNVDMNYCYKDFYTPPAPPVVEPDEPSEPETEPEAPALDEDISIGKQSGDQILTIGPMTDGDAKIFKEMAEKINIPCISTFTNNDKTLQKLAIGLIKTKDAMPFWTKAIELKVGYYSEFYNWEDTE